MKDFHVTDHDLHPKFANCWPHYRRDIEAKASKIEDWRKDQEIDPESIIPVV